jgi:mono/diheme cytochrome c family protein
MDYPIWDVAIGGGMLMGIVAIAHVIVSHFAIGGGLVIAATETLAVRRGDGEMRELARRSSLVLILISTVFGAISGVGIWVVAGLISPATISALIRNYVWGWAIEWTFFIVEIVAALVYYATWNRVSKRVHVTIGWIYFVAAYLSLVVINGIVAFMLTPGEWLTTRAFWDGFFNPTYWPSLLLRTGIALMMATAFMSFAAWRGPVAARPRLSRWLGWWMLAGALVSYVGYRWWEGALPDSIRSLFLGSSPTLAALADTRHFLLWSLTAALVLSVVFLLAVPRMAKVVPLALIALAAFSFFGGYERLREGVRKPFLIHDYMFSNGVRVDDIARINEEGALATARWAARNPAEDSSATGRQLFRAQCASCHTMDGYQAIRPLLPDDPDMIFAVLYTMREQGEAYTSAARGELVDKSELDYPFMPPLVGSEDEMYALVEYLSSLTKVDAGTEADLARAGEAP